MAAGSNVYSNRVLKVSNIGGDYIIATCPLFLEEYSTKANFCAVFHCDDANITEDAQGRKIILGLVKVGTSNYLMHAPARLGKGRISNNTEEFKILNDGGLNTYATVSASLKDGIKFANYLQLSVDFQSSYYSPSTSVGAYFKILNLSGLEVYTFSQLANKWSASSNQRVSTTLLMNQSIQGVKKGYEAQITPYIVNEEGEYRGQMLKVALDDFITNFLGTKISDLYDDPNDNQITSLFCTEENWKELSHILKDISALWDIKLYLNPNLTVEVEDGYYNIMVGATDGEVYGENELGSYIGNKAVVKVHGGRPQMWMEGRWTPPPVKKEIFVVVMAFNNNYGDWYYEIQITNNSTTPLDIYVEVYTYRQESPQRPDLIPFNRLGNHNISCNAMSSFTYRFDMFPPLSNEIGIGIDGDQGYPSYVQIAGPSILFSPPVPRM